MSELIFGKDKTERVVGVEPGSGDKCVLFIQSEDDAVSSKEVPMSHWILYTEQHSPKMKPLEGDQPFKYIMEYDNRAKYLEVLRSSKDKRLETLPALYYGGRESINAKEAFMMKEGVTMFKGLKVADVSILSFDIETTGLNHDKDSKVLLISNTFRRGGKVVKRLFAYDDYASEADMFNDWCRFVRDHDPTIIAGHNIYSYDLPYMQYCAHRAGTVLALGRDGSAIRFDENTSKFRKDGSQAYEYHNAHIYGRDIVDTYFLAIKYDISRQYENYGLKQIISQEGLEKKGRVFYEAGTIAKNYKNPVEWVKIKAYAMDDADDALALYDLMIAPFFYSTQSIPRSLQQVVNTASGSQINAIMVRGYLQQGHSIAMADEAMKYEGAISFGIPGIHKNVLRFDVSSLYPSVIRQYRIFNAKKDPQELFLKMVNYFTEERLGNKRKGKETGDRHYKDLEQSQKIMINSMYGFMGAGRVNYNYPQGAADVTRHGREILKKAILWATGKNYEGETETDEVDDEVA